MEKKNISLQSLFNRFKKVILVVLLGASGLLLAFSGLDWIKLNTPLELYSGTALLIMTVLIYLFM